MDIRNYLNKVEGFFSSKTIYVFTLNLFIFRMAIPDLKYFFLVSMTVLITKLTIGVMKNKLSFSLRQVPVLILVLFSLLLIAVFKSSRLSDVVISDMLNGAAILFLLFVLPVFFPDKQSFTVFQHKYLYQVYIFSYVAAVLGCIKFYIYLNGIELSYFNLPDGYPIGSSLVRDYNFFGLGVFLGVLSFFSLLGNDYFKKLTFWHILGFVFQTFALVFSGSRRIFLVLLTVVLCSLILYFVIYVYQYINKRQVIKRRLLHAVWLFSVFYFFFISYIFFWPADLRLGTQHLMYHTDNNFKKEISYLSYRYETIFNSNATLLGSYEEMWYSDKASSKEMIDAREQQYKETYEVTNISTEPLPYEKSTYGSRLERWGYALTIFSGYSLIEKFIGKNFDYLELFGSRFFPDREKIRYDYPHNPLLSKLLYSGLLGGALYLYFILVSGYLYIRYLDMLAAFFLQVIFVAFFSFLSANSIFGVPVFVFLVAVPFVYKKFWLK